MLFLAKALGQQQEPALKRRRRQGIAPHLAIEEYAHVIDVLAGNALLVTELSSQLPQLFQAERRHGLAQADKRSNATPQALALRFALRDIFLRRALALERDR